MGGGTFLAMWDGASKVTIRRTQRKHSQQCYLAMKTKLLSLLRPLSKAIHVSDLEFFRADLFHDFSTFAKTQDFSEQPEEYMKTQDFLSNRKSSRSNCSATHISIRIDAQLHGTGVALGWHCQRFPLWPPHVCQILIISLTLRCWRQTQP